MSDNQSKSEKTRRTPQPLLRLMPYVLRYRSLVLAAACFLAVAAATTLALPLAVRRMIDHGFVAADGAFINSYFAMLMGLAAVLAVSSALRYYYVITIGERVPI